MPDFAPWLGVFETLRVIEGVPLFVEEHRAELQRAAYAVGLNIAPDPRADAREFAGRSGRWRWIVDQAGTRTFFTPEMVEPATVIALSLSALRVGAQNWDARFKTFSYLTHTQALAMSPTPETVLRNEHGVVTSAARANLFWRRSSRLYTPAHEAGCRCGVVRDFVLRIERVGVGHFGLDDLIGADEIFLTNSMRGIVSVESLEGAPLTDFSCAHELRQQYGRLVEETIGAFKGARS